MTIPASPREQSSGSEGVSYTPRFWLTAFWGFEPEHEGYYGFTLEGGRKRFLDNYQDGDLILVYGADVQNTAKADRKQVLGILEVEPREIWDTDKISVHGLQEKKRLDKEVSWKFAVPVKRAWKLNRQIAVGQVFPDTYLPGNGQALASFGMIVSDREASNVLSWPVTEVSVFGEPPILASKAEIAFEAAYASSKGIQPSFGERTSDYVDSECSVYLMKYSGDLAVFLGLKPFELQGISLIKVGYSNDPNRRLVELNSGFPPSAASRWKLRLKSRPFPDAATALAAEDRLKEAFTKTGKSQGGEFFLCSEKLVDTTFSEVAADTAFRIIAPKRQS
jgi:hypothetical protein